MKLPQLISQLEKSQIFKDFKEKNPDAFLCAGFFIMNFKTNVNEYNLDYRNDKEIFTFKIPLTGEIIMLKENMIETQKPLEKLNTEISIDVGELEELAKKELIRNGVKNRLEEIICVLQNKETKTIWHLTCMCESFAIITIQINAYSGNIMSFEKKNLFDFIKK